MRKTRKAAFSLFKISLLDGLQYRLASFTGAIVGALVAVLDIIILTVFYRYGSSNGSVNNLSLSQAASYIWLGQLLVLMQFSSIEGDIRNKIVNGDIGIELCRPLDLYWHWFSRSAASKASALLLRGSMTVIIGCLFTAAGQKNYGFAAPLAPVNFIFFVLSSVCALVFSTSFGMLLTAFRVNVNWGDGLVNILTVSGMLLSGVFFPLQLWPDKIQVFLRYQPFASVLDTPAKLYVGSVTIENAAQLILIQIVWTVLFIMAGKVVLRNKLKGLVVQGG